MKFNLFSKSQVPQDKRTAWLQLDDYSAHPVEGPCSIGRAKTNSVSINDEKVSRLHALVHIQERGEHWLVDLGSSNGTYLNGKRVVQPSLWKDLDLIQIGEHNLRFYLKNQPDVPDADNLENSQITVQEMREVPSWFLVADIEGFVELGGKMNSDELARAVGEWLATCNRLIQQHQGTIRQYLGDGFAAYWDGRKVPAGEVADCMDALKKLQKNSKFQYRLAIHFGKASIGGSPMMGEAGLFGRDINLAFRMEKLAKSLSIPCILSEAAYEAFSKPASAQSLGSHTLRGFDESFVFYKV
jgi:adenylate cyclase